MTISKKDRSIIASLRKNAREKVTIISRNLDVPATTVYDKLRSFDKKYVKRHCCLIDFSKMGFPVNVFVSIRPAGQKNSLKDFLFNSPNVNSLYTTSMGDEYLFEGFFRDYDELTRFKESIEDIFSPTSMRVINIASELKKESFLTNPEHFEV